MRILLRNKFGDISENEFPDGENLVIKDGVVYVGQMCALEAMLPVTITLEGAFGVVDINCADVTHVGTTMPQTHGGADVLPSQVPQGQVQVVLKASITQLVLRGCNLKTAEAVPDETAGNVVHVNFGNKR